MDPDTLAFIMIVAGCFVLAAFVGLAVIRKAPSMIMMISTIVLLVAVIGLFFDSL